MARKPSPKPPLTPKQQRFVEEYLRDPNATRAYRAAGYKARTDNTAAAASSKLLRNNKIAAAITLGEKARSERVHVDIDWVLQRLVIEARGTAANVRVRAMELIGRHLGMFLDKVEHSGKVHHELDDLSEAEIDERIRTIESRLAEAQASQARPAGTT